MQQSNSALGHLGHLIVEVSRSHTIRHTHLVALLWISDQLVAGAIAYTTHNKHEMNIRACIRIQTCDPRNRVDAAQHFQ